MRTHESHLHYLIEIFNERKKSIEFSIKCNEEANNSIMAKYFKGKLDNLEDVIEDIEWIINNDTKILVKNQLFTKRKKVSSLDIKYLNNIPDYLQNKKVQVSKELIKNEIYYSFKSSNEYPSPSIFSDGHYDESSSCKWYIDGIEHYYNNSSHNDVINKLIDIIDNDKDSKVEVIYSDGCC